MATNVSQFSRVYNSFSGVDIKAVFQGKTVGDLQAISYSVTREKAPIYTMGSADPRSYSRGKRGIAGTMIFIVFDQHGLLELMKTRVFWSDKDDVRPVAVNQNTSKLDELVAPNADPTRPILPANQGAEMEIQDVFSDQELMNPWYSDQIPPFDVVLAANNEYGASAKMVIYGCEILNEGSGFSIDDIVVETQFTYAARMIFPWTRVTNVMGKAVWGGLPEQG